MKVKRWLLFLIFTSTAGFLFAQRIGINTSNPAKLLSVNGSVQIDQNNTNDGTIDSAALVFGSTGVGIFSNKNATAMNLHGLDFWTGNARRLTISSAGWVGINLNTLPTAFLDVNGPVRARNSLSVNTNLTVQNNATVNNDLTVANDATVNGSLTVGSNGVFTVKPGGSVFIGGRGIVRSNNSTPLRMGFSSGAFGITLNGGQYTDISFGITPFTGDYDDIRVSICQFFPEAGGNNTWQRITTTVWAVNPSIDICTIRFYNTASTSSVMAGRL